MDISEAETGTMGLRRSEVAGATALVEQAVDSTTTSRRTRHRRIAGTWKRPRSSAPIATACVRCFANLIDNAVKYTPAGGRVDICASARRQATPSIEVADTGVGIPPEELPRIWERLYRGDRSRAERGLGPRPEPGQGDRRGPRRHGSTVRSTPGEGSMFTVRLPLVPRRCQHAVASSCPRRSFHRCNGPVTARQGSARPRRIAAEDGSGSTVLPSQAGLACRDARSRAHKEIEPS